MADMERVAISPEAALFEDGFDLSRFDAAKTVDELSDFITEVYFPLRGQEGFGTERAIISEAPHVPHRENDMEHSSHIADCIIILEDNQKEFGIGFPPGFNFGYATQDANTHDLIERWVPDTDAMTSNIALLRDKSKNERLAALRLSQRPGYIGKLALRMLAHLDKKLIEIKTVADVEHCVAPLVIMADGGRRWQDWEGETTDCDEMCRRIRGKLSTSFGHALFDEVEKRVRAHPEYFIPPAD